MESTREMAEMAASPTLETMTVSAIPTVISRTCSTTRGRMRRRSSFAENIIYSVSPFPVILSIFRLSAGFRKGRGPLSAKPPRKRRRGGNYWVRSCGAKGQIALAFSGKLCYYGTGSYPPRPR